MANGLIAKLERGVKQTPFWEFHIGLAILLITGLTHCAWLLISPRLYYVYHDGTSSNGSMVSVVFSTEWILLRIGAAMVGAGVLLLRKSGIGLLLSALCLMWAVCEYIHWYLLSRSLPKEGLILGLGSHAEAGNAFFYGATNWNVAVLSIAAVMLVWELILIWKSMQRE